jgi:hypothetical protein
MREVMTQIVEGHLVDEIPLRFGGAPFQRPQPMVNACLSETLLELGGEAIALTAALTLAPAAPYRQDRFRPRCG